MSNLLPYQERVVSELEQRQAELTKLRAFIASDDFRAVERAERQRLMRQEAAMTELVTVLNERVAAFPAAPQEGDFPLGKACDLSGDGTCEACQ